MILSFATKCTSDKSPTKYIVHMFKALQGFPDIYTCSLHDLLVHEIWDKTFVSFNLAVLNIKVLFYNTLSTLFIKLKFALQRSYY